MIWVFPLLLSLSPTATLENSQCVCFFSLARTGLQCGYQRSPPSAGEAGEPWGCNAGKMKGEKGERVGMA
jgi:hypothetical protein